jgi:hypothetical protein
LTVNPRHGQTAESRAAELSNAWRIVVKRARRKFTKVRLEFLAVFEETLKGEPHLHIVARAPYIPQRWLSEQMAELIQAPIVDIRKVNSAVGAARYVAKYVAKGPRAFGSLKRYWQSPGYDAAGTKKKREMKEDAHTWQIYQQPLWSIAEMWAQLGHVVTWTSEHELFSSHVGARERAPP